MNNNMNTNKTIEDALYEVLRIFREAVNDNLKDFESESDIFKDVMREIDKMSEKLQNKYTNL